MIAQSSPGVFPVLPLPFPVNRLNTKKNVVLLRVWVAVCGAPSARGRAGALSNWTVGQGPRILDPTVYQLGSTKTVCDYRHTAVG